jgi:peptidoglycan/xylan/chitin deacetylase (PgdA/CDA1 family)
MARPLRAMGHGFLSILKLHRFSDPQYGIVGHDTNALRDQLAYLRRYRYRLLSLTDLLQSLETGTDDAATPGVAFTVDDGYDDFARIGAPIFAEYDCPVTLFVPTGFVVGQLWLWWDRVAYLFHATRRATLQLQLGPATLPYCWGTPAERAAVQQDVLYRLERVDAAARDAAIGDLARQCDVELPAKPPPAYAPISWDDVRRTAQRGATFGPHTVTHPILPLTTDATCEWEIEQSYHRLRQQTDAWVPVFCYPAGQAGPRECEAVQRAGLQAAVTSFASHAAPPRSDRGPVDGFAVPRFPHPDDRARLVQMVSGLGRLRGLF